MLVTADWDRYKSEENRAGSQGFGTLRAMWRNEFFIAGQRKKNSPVPREPVRHVVQVSQIVWKSSKERKHMKTLKSLWSDEAGAIVSIEVVLVITILGIGMIVGLKSVRDAVVDELADVAAAVGDINQSYSYSGVSGHAASTAGGVYVDTPDFCEVPGDSQGSGHHCVNVGVDGANE
ncbi:MAG: hypothetical protein Tsb009_22730 [Planctomycetaceae bacterium]